MDCSWPGNDIEMIKYHDHEWGVPVTNSRNLFEKLILDAFQAGLSWKIVLHKRHALKSALADFDPFALSRWSQSEIDFALQQPNIIRNRLKVAAAAHNAKIWINLEQEYGFATWLWKFIDFEPINGLYERHEDVPTQDEISIKVSQALRKEGFKFCGPVMVMAFMEAVGMRNHHLVSCAQHAKCLAQAEKVKQYFK